MNTTARRTGEVTLIPSVPRRALLVLVLLMASATWAGQEPKALDEKFTAYCASRELPQDRIECERYYSAEPYTYTVHTAPPGNGYKLCERFADNLRAVAEPPTCEVKIHPRYAHLFQTVEWEILDPKDYPDLLYHADAASSTPGEWKLRTGAEYWPTYDIWRSRFEEKLKTENEGGLLTRELSRAYFDANGDGKPEWMLGYRFKRPCNPWGTSAKSTAYSHFALKDDGRTVDREIMRPNHQVLGISGGGTYPITTTIRDPRNPETRTYLLGVGFGLVVDHATGRRTLEGQTFHLFAATRWGLGQVLAHHVCTFELLKQPPTPIIPGR